MTKPFMLVNAVPPPNLERARDAELLDAYMNAPRQTIDYALLSNARFGPDRAAMQNNWRGGALDVTPELARAKPRRFSEKQRLYMRRMKRLLKVMRLCGCEVHA